MKIQKILVPVDFSAYSNKALEYAIYWAETFGAELTLVHVNTLFHEHHDYSALLNEYQELVLAREEQIWEWMEAHHQTARRRNVRVAYDVVNGFSAAQTILDYLKRHPFDLVVMGTHGRTGLKHLMQGSVTEKVSRLSPVPVLAIHKDLQDLAINNILVPVDFSEYSRTVVETAVDLARQFGARVQLIHVLERPTPANFDWIVEEMESAFQIDPEVLTKVHQTLRSYIVDDYRQMISESILTGHPYEEIINYTRSNRVDLIIMACRGFSRFEYFWLWGSNTERVLRLAPCPVLALRTHLAEKPHPPRAEMETK